MLSSQLLLCCLSALSLSCLQGGSLQCFSCNVGGGHGQGQGYVELGCKRPEIINCSATHGGFKVRRCITTTSRPLDLVLSRGCATSRHCQQTELPGVSVACCDWSLCNDGGQQWMGSVTAVIICYWFPLQGLPDL